MTDCWIFPFQNNNHFFENMKGWQRIYEHGPFSLYWHCVQLNLSENVLDYLQKKSLMKMCIYMEEVNTLIPSI
jgi:hypothetical protein